MAGEGATDRGAERSLDGDVHVGDEAPIRLEADPEAAGDPLPDDAAGLSGEPQRRRVVEAQLLHRDARRPGYGRYSLGIGLSGRSSSHTAPAIHQRTPSQNSSMLLMPRPNTGPSARSRIS